MNIIVLLKQVVDVELNIRVKDGELNEEGLNYVISSWDETAIEAALQFKEALDGDGEVTLISIGPERAEKSLRKGLAIGADKAIHILDSAFDGSDSFAYAKGLSKILKQQGPYDVILAGKQAQDTDAGLTASMLAEFLDLPQVTNISQADKVEANQLTLQRKGDHGNEVIELSLPAVITVSDSFAEPRLASLRAIMQAKKKPLATFSLADLDIDPNLIGDAGSKTTVERWSEPEARQAGEKFEGDEVETAKQVLDLLVNETKIFATLSN